MINRALDIGISSIRQYAVNPLWGRRVTTPVPLIAAATDFAIVARPAALTALGPELVVGGYTRVSLWLNVDVNQMTGFRFACYGRHTTGGSNYSMPIYNPSVGAPPYSILADGEEVILARDADQLIVLTWDIANTFPFIQFGFAATVDGGDNGQLLSAHVTYGWGS